ncbi:hypothetical protein ACTJ29_003574 [Vibrio vulnificus]
MSLISSLACVFLFAMLRFYAKLNPSLSFVLASIFFISSHFGHSSAFSYVLLMLSTFYLATFDRSVVIKRYDTAGLSLTLVALIIILNLSLINGGEIYLNILKFIQVAFIFLSLILLAHYNQNGTVSIRKFNKIVVSFFIVNIGFGFIANSLFGVYDLGLFRFSGITFDANYFGVFVLCLLFISYSDRFLEYKYIKTSRALLFFLLLLSGSVTVISALLVFLFLRRFLPRLLLNPFIFLFLIWAGFFIYLEFISFFSGLELSSNGSTFLQFKINSIKLRLSPQIIAVDMLKDNHAWFTGFGSGRNIQLTGKAVHNGLLQLLFSHGVLYFCFLTTFITYILNVLVRSYHNERRFLYSVFYSLIVVSFLLDPFFILAFQFFILILKVVHDDPIRSCYADAWQGKRSA